MKIYKEDISVSAKIATLASAIKQLQANNKLIEEKHWSEKTCLQDNYCLCQLLNTMSLSLQEDIKQLIKTK